MKKLFILALFVIGFVNVYAQDILQLKDGLKIEVKLIEVSESSIKYKRWDNLNGPTYTISITKVSSILYENGVFEEFDVDSTAKSDIAASIDNATTNVSNSIYNSGNSIAREIDNSVELRKNELKNQAHNLKMIGWISGLIFLGGSLAIGITTETYWLCGVAGGGAGLIIGICEGIANNKIRVANSIAMTNIGYDINDNLNLGLCHFNYIPEQSHALGIGLTLKF